MLASQNIVIGLISLFPADDGKHFAFFTSCQPDTDTEKVFKYLASLSELWKQIEWILLCELAL